MVFLCLSVCEQSLLEQLPQDDPDYIYNMGCLLYQDSKYEEACKKFMSAMQVLGYVPGTHPKTCAHMKMPSVVLTHLAQCPQLKTSVEIRMFIKAMAS